MVMNAALDIIRRKIILPILDNPFGHKWQVQGLGMLRTYIDPDTRLHVWDSRLNYCADSGWHTHPWDFSSFIVAGHITNRRYLARIPNAHNSGKPFTEQHIICGPGGCAKSLPKDVLLMEMTNEHYYAGDTYQQRADEIHSTETQDGSITVITRKTIHEDGSANVYFPKGSEWSSAEARPAEDFEIIQGVKFALQRLEAEGGL